MFFRFQVARLKTILEMPKLTYVEFEAKDTKENAILLTYLRYAMSIYYQTKIIEHWHFVYDNDRIRAVTTYDKEQL